MPTMRRMQIVRNIRIWAPRLAGSEAEAARTEIIFTTTGVGQVWSCAWYRAACPSRRCIRSSRGAIATCRSLNSIRIDLVHWRGDIAKLRPLRARDSLAARRDIATAEARRGCPQSDDVGGRKSRRRKSIKSGWRYGRSNPSG
jgi:hypothetical protein